MNTNEPKATFLNMSFTNNEPCVGKKRPDLNEKSIIENVI